MSSVEHVLSFSLKSLEDNLLLLDVSNKDGSVTSMFRCNDALEAIFRLGSVNELKKIYIILNNKLSIMKLKTRKNERSDRKLLSCKDFLDQDCRYNAIGLLQDWIDLYKKRINY